MVSFLKNISFSVLFLAVYIVSLVSAFYVKPYLWLVIGLLFTIYGMYSFTQNRFLNRGVASVAIFTNGIFIALGQYLEFYIPIASIFTNLFGFFASFPLMIVFYYWKEGHKKQDIIIRQKKVEVVIKTSPVERIKIFIRILRELQQFKKTHSVSPWFSLKYTIIKTIYLDQNIRKNNAIDFTLGRRATLERSEHDQTSRN